ncbi:MAG: hypothetical protein Q8N39_01615 [Pelolinea sp.]|nr:hypothetical protein [Pelolinea sp.]
MFVIRNLRWVAVLIAILIMATAAYDFADVNIVQIRKAGDGSGAISGYTVSNIHYVLNGTNPFTIDSVTFTLDTAPVSGGTIKIKPVNAGSTWYSCTNTGVNVTCNNGSTLNAPVNTANSLEVVVAQ